jgi:hypothetical protein
MSKWPKPSIVGRTAERNTSLPLIRGVRDEFLERADDLAVHTLRAVAYHEHSAARESDIFHSSIHLYTDAISHYSYIR